MSRIPVNPGVLTWARERAGMDIPALEKRFPKFSAWESGQQQPTLRQLEDFARVVHVAVGYLFLPSPPQEPLPIPDFRTVAGREVRRPSPNLLDTIYLCQQRQEWFRDYARIYALPTLDFVGSVTSGKAPVHIAETMRQRIGLSVAERQRLPTWTDALRQLIAKAEDAGILVMVSGVVGSNSNRKLSVEEFRGFVLADDLAPLVFINGADSKAAQMFTLAHELAHLWLGQSGISNSEAGRLADQGIERWCNAVAAEFLMPLALLRQDYRGEVPIADEIHRLARSFKVSTLVVLRRLFDAGFINEPTFWENYRKELTRIGDVDQPGRGGGDFYRTLGARTGKRFARAVLSSALEGQTLFQDAFRMLGVRKTATFYRAARELGVML